MAYISEKCPSSMAFNSRYEYIYTTQLDATCIVSDDSHRKRKPYPQKAESRDTLAIVKYQYQA